MSDYAKVVKNLTSGIERAFYSSKDTEFINITIDGIEDGESAFKCSKNIKISDSNFVLRYPFWHNDHLIITNSKFYDTCRASLWYVNDLKIENSKILGVKAIREAQNVTIIDSQIESSEFSFNVDNMKLDNCHITSDAYGFFQNKNLELNKVQYKGKYSFQYGHNIKINNSNLDTKDAFWHSENVVVRDSYIKGEYLAWYANNITFINCIISGTQPFCYTNNLTLINCKMEGCDLAFEHSVVDAEINSSLVSIKNPNQCHIVCDKVDDIILDEVIDNQNVDIKERNK